MSLEKELVLRLIKEGNSIEDTRNVIDLIQDPNLESPYKPLKLDNSEIQAELNRQKLLEKYNSPENSKKNVKEKIKEKIGGEINEKVREIMNDPYVVEVKVKTSFPSGIPCENCNSWTHYTKSAKIVKLIEGEGGLVQKQNKINFFDYCPKCGEISHIYSAEENSL